MRMPNTRFGFRVRDLEAEESYQLVHLATIKNTFERIHESNVRLLRYAPYTNL